MRLSSNVITKTAFLIGGLCLPTFVHAQAYSGPKCLGLFCLDQIVSLDSLAQRLGGPSSGGGIYGYRAKDGQAFLIIAQRESGELGYVSLRDFAKWGMWQRRDEKLTSEELHAWKTAEGIGLGSSEEDVLETYGKPSGTVDLITQDTGPQTVQKKLIYKGHLDEVVRAAMFGIRSGKVSSIELERDAFVGPDCLGPYCYDDGLSLRSLYRLLRLSSRKMRPPSVMCIQAQDGQAFMHFRTDVESLSESDIDDVLLSDFPNCLHMHERITTNSLRAWKTPEGIGLGSSEDDVVKTYGTPSAEKKLDAQKPILEIKGLIAGYRKGESQPRVADKVIIYGPRELQAADFGIRDGKVSYIWLKDSDFWLKEGE